MLAASNAATGARERTTPCAAKEMAASRKFIKDGKQENGRTSSWDRNPHVSAAGKLSNMVIATTFPRASPRPLKAPDTVDGSVRSNSLVFGRLRRCATPVPDTHVLHVVSKPERCITIEQPACHSHESALALPQLAQCATHWNFSTDAGLGSHRVRGVCVASLQPCQCSPLA